LNQVSPDPVNIGGPPRDAKHRGDRELTDRGRNVERRHPAKCRPHAIGEGGIFTAIPKLGSALDYDGEASTLAVDYVHQAHCRPKLFLAQGS